MNLEIKSFYGNEIADWIDIIGEMRISQFKRSPYLYAGNIDIERQYLSIYSSNDQGALVMALDKDNIVGLMTGVPLFQTPSANEFIKIIGDSGMHPEQFYYCEECIVTPTIQDQDSVSLLCEKLSEYVVKLGYKYLYYIAIDSNENVIGNKTGFAKTNMKIKQTWPSFQSNGQIISQSHNLDIWIKTL